METASRNSKASMTSSFKRRYNSLLATKTQHDGAEPIDEQEVEITDKDGNTI